MANDAYNHAPKVNSDLSPIEIFANLGMRPLLRRFHHFGCPVYVLANDLQTGKKGRKWQDRAQVGIYLGHSPQHARSVSLVLSLQTGLVSPQYHCSFDDMFETTRASVTRLIPASEWQVKAHFKAPSMNRTRERTREQTLESSSDMERKLIADIRSNNHAPRVQELQNPMQSQGEENPKSTETATGTVIEDGIRRSTRTRRQPERMSDYVAYEALTTVEV
jgi:hypothetical protein